VLVHLPESVLEQAQPVHQALLVQVLVPEQLALVPTLSWPDQASEAWEALEECHRWEAWEAWEEWEASQAWQQVVVRGAWAACLR
jgi:hypothetical protein